MCSNILIIADMMEQGLQSYGILMWAVQCNSFMNVHEEWLIQLWMCGVSVLSVSVHVLSALNVWHVLRYFRSIFVAVLSVLLVFGGQPSNNTSIQKSENVIADTSLLPSWTTKGFNTHILYVILWHYSTEGSRCSYYVGLSVIFTASTLFHICCSLCCSRCF